MHNVSIDPYSPTILKNVLCLVLQTFLYLATFECKPYSVADQQLCYITKSCTKRMFLRMVGENGPSLTGQVDLNDLHQKVENLWLMNETNFLQILVQVIVPPQTKCLAVAGVYWNQPVCVCVYVHQSVYVHNTYTGIFVLQTPVLLLVS